MPTPAQYEQAAECIAGSLYRSCYISVIEKPEATTEEVAAAWEDYTFKLSCCGIRATLAGYRFDHKLLQRRMPK